MAAVEDTTSSSSALKAGDAVRAFYHMGDHPNGFRYVRLLDAAPEEAPESKDEESLVIGLSTGWMPATVAEDWKPGQSGPDQRVLVKLHGTFADAYRKDPGPVVGMYWELDRALVRPMGAAQPKVELALLVLRWWDYWNPRHLRSSRSHNVANEHMLLDFLENEGSPHQSFGKTGGYQVHSAFIRSSADLALVDRRLFDAMRGQRRAGMYFLWPTQRQAKERQMHGCVDEVALMEVMTRMEAEGITTCFPHPVPLYRELAGKLWAPKVCSARPELRVAPTVLVEAAAFEANPQAQAEAAIATLRRLRQEAPGGSGGGDGPYRGVAKLGFSWMGEDVYPFTGPEELTKMLRLLFDGASRTATCLVQERIEDVVCEMRSICFRDLTAGPDVMRRELARMKLKQPQHPQDRTFALTSHNFMSHEEAAQQAFGGNGGAVRAAEQEVSRLSDLWLAWLREEGHGTPPHMRFDFLVSMRAGGSAADVQVHTVELCEAGGALCGCAAAPRATACLNDCLSVEPPAGFPLPLPTLLEPVRPQPAPPSRPPPRGARRAEAPAPAAGSATLSLLRSLVKGGRKWAVLVALLAAFLLRARLRRLR